MYFGKLPKSLDFTDQHRRLLKNLVFDEHSPAPILHDFTVLLNTFKSKRQVLTATHQLPLKVLREVNEQLKHPIELDLKRPTQKSYPNIVGLYLLLRASGLTYLDESGKKPILNVDENAYEQWKNLNATEQYGVLLEAWLLRGFTEIIDERQGYIPILPTNFYGSVTFMGRYDVKGGLKIAGNRHAEATIRYFPGLHNVSLLECFGWITIQSGSPQEGKGWHIEKITLTSLGEAFINLFYQDFFSDFDRIFELEYDDENQFLFGVLQKILQPYLPSWKNNLIPPEETFREGVHVFKVSLGSVWARIAIDAKQPLIKLAYAILSFVGFDDDHLYDFSYHNRFGIQSRINHPYTEEYPTVSEVLVGKVPLRVGQTMVFTFDYGHNWQFDVLLESVDANRVVTEVEILEKHGEPPAQYPNWEDGGDFEIYLDEDFEP